MASSFIVKVRHVNITLLFSKSRTHVTRITTKKINKSHQVESSLLDCFHCSSNLMPGRAKLRKYLDQQGVYHLILASKMFQSPKDSLYIREEDGNQIDHLSLRYKPSLLTFLFVHWSRRYFAADFVCRENAN